MLGKKTIASIMLGGSLVVASGLLVNADTFSSKFESIKTNIEAFKENSLQYLEDKKTATMEKDRLEAELKKANYELYKANKEVEALNDYSYRLSQYVNDKDAKNNVIISNNKNRVDATVQNIENEKADHDEQLKKWQQQNKNDFPLDEENMPSSEEAPATEEAVVETGTN